MHPVVSYLACHGRCHFCPHRAANLESQDFHKRQRNRCYRNKLVLDDKLSQAQLGGSVGIHGTAPPTEPSRSGDSNAVLTPTQCQPAPQSSLADLEGVWTHVPGAAHTQAGVQGGVQAGGLLSTRNSVGAALSWSGRGAIWPPTRVGPQWLYLPSTPETCYQLL